MIRRTSAATSRRTTWRCTGRWACPRPTSRNSQAIRSKARSCRRPTRVPGCRKSASSLLARSEFSLLLEEALVDRLVLEDLLARETLDFVREDQPAVRGVKEIVRLERAAIAFGLVVNRRYPDLPRQIAPAAAPQLADDRFEAVPGIEHIVDDQQLVLERQPRDQVIHRVDAHDLGLLIDAGIERSADRDVIGMDAVVLEYLLDRDADRSAASPDGDQKCGFEPAAHDSHGELDRIA